MVSDVVSRLTALTVRFLNHFLNSPMVAEAEPDNFQWLAIIRVMDLHFLIPADSAWKLLNLSHSDGISSHLTSIDFIPVFLPVPGGVNHRIAFPFWALVPNFIVSQYFVSLFPIPKFDHIDFANLTLPASRIKL